MTKSNFELALENLGFDDVAKQRALLKIFSLAEYFTANQVWQDLLHLVQEDDHTHSQATRVWQQIFSKLKSSHADEPSHFDAHLLQESFKQTPALDIKFLEDYLLYVVQHAFGRKIGVEFNQVQTQSWMETYGYEYLEAAKTLGLVDRVHPVRAEYDEAWIAGANRIGLMARFIDYQQLIDSGSVNIGHTLALVGARPAWANFDGIAPDMLKKLDTAHRNKINIDDMDIFLPVGEDPAMTEEGKKYLIELVEREGIKLDPAHPFIQYAKSECPKGLFPNNWYPNYAEGETKRITETIIARDLSKQYLNTEIALVDTESQQGLRPTTASTSFDAAKIFLSKLNLAEIGSEPIAFHVLLISNNPYVERQKEAAQAQANKVLLEFNREHSTYITIEIDGAGFSNKQDVATIHSELSALIAEQWKKLHPNDASEHLFYRTRSHDDIDVPCPELYIVGKNSEDSQVPLDLAA